MERFRCDSKFGALFLTCSNCTNNIIIDNGTGGWDNKFFKVNKFKNPREIIIIDGSNRSGWTTIKIPEYYDVNTEYILSPLTIDYICDSCSNNECKTFLEICMYNKEKIKQEERKYLESEITKKENEILKMKDKLNNL
jgi:hypothetical protein